MCSCRLLQLIMAVLLRALAQEVDDAAAGGAYPVDGRMPVHEAQHFDTGQEVAARRPVADDFDGVTLSLGDAGRCHLHAVHLEFLQQQAGNHELLVGHEGHSAGLFAVAEGGVHDFYYGMGHRFSSFWVDGEDADDADCADGRCSPLFVFTIRFTWGIPPKLSSSPTCRPVALR